MNLSLMMDRLLRFAISNPLVRAHIMNLIRLVVAGFAAWLVSHMWLQSAAEQYFIDALVSALAVLLGAQDVQTVDKKINTAIALPPKSNAETISDLKNGQF